METLKGCPRCRETMPPNQIVNGPHGSTLLRRCPDCGTEWLRHPLSGRKAMALLAARRAPQLLRAFAAAVEAHDKVRYTALLDEIETFHGPVAAAALRDFLTAIGASMAASLAIRAPDKRFPGNKRTGEQEGGAG